MTRSMTLAALAIAAFALAGCTQPVSGAGPSGSGGQPSSTGAPSGSSTGGSPLAGVDPCALLTPAEIAQLGLPGAGKANAVASRSCTWRVVSDGYVLTIFIEDSSGLKDIVPQGGSVSNVAVGKHDGRRLEAQNGDAGSCRIAIGVTSSSRVDVEASDINRDTAKGCQIAKQVATKVEPHLPS